MSQLSTVLENLPVNKHNDEQSWGEIATASSFLKRIQLYTGSSPSISGGLIGSGKFGLVMSKDVIDDLGGSIDCIPYSWRFKAMNFNAEVVVSCYDPKSAEFKDIQAKSEESDSGCSFGIEFLLWLPSRKVFATYFMNSKTSRREAPNVKNNLGKPTTIRSNLIKRGNKQWHGPVTSVCSTPFDLPADDEVLKQATLFANPKESEAEPAEVSSRPQ